MGFPGGSVVKNLPANVGDMSLFLGWEDTLEKATHSSIIAWEIPGQARVHGIAEELNMTQ